MDDILLTGAGLNVNLIVVLSWCIGSPRAKVEFLKDAAVKSEMVSDSKPEELPVFPTTPSRNTAPFGK